MDALAPLKQLKELEATQRGLGSLSGWSPLPWPAGQEEPMAVAVWSPLLDISESEEEYLIQAELPGVKKGAVKIIAEENTLTITGEREFKKEAMSKKRLRAERAYGSFGRRFSLPDDANPAKLSAEFIDGVLTVRLAKKEKSKPQQEEGVDEITVWWQKTLGKKAVLGQASNRAPPGQRAPTPKLLWTKPESGHAQQEIKVVEATPRATEKNGGNP
jgi:HSP20 family protein